MLSWMPLPPASSLAGQSLRLRSPAASSRAPAATLLSWPNTGQAERRLPSCPWSLLTAHGPRLNPRWVMSSLCPRLRSGFLPQKNLSPYSPAGAHVFSLPLLQPHLLVPPARCPAEGTLASLLLPGPWTRGCPRAFTLPRLCLHALPSPSRGAPTSFRPCARVLLGFRPLAADALYLCLFISLRST